VMIDGFRARSSLRGAIASELPAHPHLVYHFEWERPRPHCLRLPFPPVHWKGVTKKIKGCARIALKQSCRSRPRET